VHLLVTSRRLVRLRGEREFPLAPLPVPEPAVDGSLDDVDRVAAEPAVALFVDHAAAARPGFRLDASNAAAVAELCRRVDGLPLAIELVAARTRLLTPEALLERVGDELHLVPTSSADVPDRQRTLRATIEWSHRMLDANERALFALLGVFSGGAPLDAIEAVCGVDAVGDVIETLASLLDKSLVVVTGGGAHGADVSMLPTVRAYALECLAASEDLCAARDRHARWYRALARSCDPAAGPGATDRWGGLAAALPNVRAAVTWLTERDDSEGLADIAASLWRWYWITGRVAEGRTWIGALSSRIPPPSGAPDSVVTARLCTAVGSVHFSFGDHQRAEALLRRALVAFDAADDDVGAGQVAMMLAAVDALDGDRTGALELARRAVAASRRLDLDWGLAQALTLLGSLVRQSGADAEGRDLQREALDIVRQVGEPVLEGQILGHLALGEVHAGDVAAAAAFLADAVRCCRPTHQLETTARLLEIGAAIAHADARVRDAVLLDAAADAIRAQLGTPLWPAMKAEREALVAACAASLDDAEFGAATAEGRVADPDALLCSVATAHRELAAA
jgi:predicted ATPase